MSVQQIQLMLRAALLAGILSGGLLFIFQYVVIVPRILAAEEFEAHGEHDHHSHSEWKPSEGWERSAFTAAGTILTGVGFAALLLSIIILGNFGLNVRSGLLWGAAGFACFTVAPALGMLPVPPGVPVADVGARQLWWVMTVGLTALGLGLIVNSGRRWSLRAGGAALLLLPHAIGAPQITGPQVVPANLVRDFAVVSIAGNGLFWIALGAMTGWLYPVKHDATPI